MSTQLLAAKLAQLVHITRETEEWLRVSASAFGADTKLIRACQRNLQLLVEYASDINGIVILDLGKKAPESYRQSFLEVFSQPAMAGLGRVMEKRLLDSVKWRNVLIHEYEPEGDHRVFYDSLKKILVAYQRYARCVRTM